MCHVQSQPAKAKAAANYGADIPQMMANAGQVEGHSASQVHLARNWHLLVDTVPMGATMGM